MTAVADHRKCSWRVPRQCSNEAVWNVRSGAPDNPGGRDVCTRHLPAAVRYSAVVNLGGYAVVFPVDTSTEKG
jgi:hypothetical protein